LKGNELRESVKEGESKGEGLKRTIQVSRKGKERAINVKGSNILRELIQEEKQRIRDQIGEGSCGDVIRPCLFNVDEASGHATVNESLGASLDCCVY
jgi:hypothetical protein